MGKNLGSFIRSTWLLVPAIVLVLAVSIANGQTASSRSTQEEVATAANPSASKALTTDVPAFTDYRGVTIGMSADEVRSKLDRIKEGKRQDYLSFSDRESAQIYYDEQGKVMAVSIDYFDNSNAPTPEAVLGVELVEKANGAMYQLVRYPDAGYWVSYNKTAGDKPIVTITMQKM